MHALVVLGYWNLFLWYSTFKKYGYLIPRGKNYTEKWLSHSLDQFFNVCQLAVQDISCIIVAVNDHWNCFKYSASACIGKICIFDTACTCYMQYALIIQQNIKQVNNNRWSEKHWSSRYNAVPPCNWSFCTQFWLQNLSTNFFLFKKETKDSKQT